MILTLLGVCSAMLTLDEQGVSVLAKENSVLVSCHTKEGSSFYKDCLDLEKVFEGYLEFAHVDSADEELVFHGLEDPLKEKPGKVGIMAQFLLKSIKALIDFRAINARAEKAYLDFLDKEKERAKKQTDDEKKLAERSDLLRLTPATYEEHVNKDKVPLLYLLYVANSSNSIHYYTELEKTASKGLGQYITGKINCTEYEGFCKQFGVEVWPQLIYYPAGNKQIKTYVKYQPRHSNTGYFFHEWAVENGKKTTSAKAIEPLSKANFDKVCKNSKTVCFVLFGDSAPLKEKAESLLKEYSDKPITFFTSTIADQKQLAKQFGIESEPAMFFLHGVRKRYEVVIREELTSDYLEEKLAAIMAGERNNFQNYKFEEAVI